MPILPSLALLLLCILVDIFIYRRLRRASTPRALCNTHIVISILGIAGLFWLTFIPKKTGTNADLVSIMWVLYALLSIYVPKILFCLFALVRAALSKIFKRPLRGIAVAGGVVSVFVFGAMWWGALFNRYDIDVREVDVEIPSLPSQFIGLRIAQISDIHTGSYAADTTFLSKVVDKVNGLHPDIILFTGDIVNRRSDELKPFAGVLSRLHAPLGVFSVMGNHDYGDYYTWPTDSDHTNDVIALKNLQGDMGWHMLNNSHVWLRAGTDSIALIGVENIGDPPFHCYGSLKQAYPTPADEKIKILMSHNPSHWVDSIAGCDDMNIALTLAGHTHAMQIELLGWSPAALRYKTWGGLYDDGDHRQLYVNIGLGEVAMPARIGATPEVTLITLR